MFTVPFHFLMNYLFVIYYECGFEGVGYATNVSCTFSLLLILLRINFDKDSQFLLPNYKEIFSDLSSYFSLALAGLLISCFEEWINQALALLAGTMGVS